MVRRHNYLDDEASAFQAQMIALTRAFGWHRPDSTPCGEPVPIAEAHALLELGKVDGLTQQELGSALNLCKSTVSRLVTKLEDRGWVQRAADSSDARVRRVTVTAEGEAAARQLAEARAEKMTAVLDQIPEWRRPQVMEALEALVEAMHASDE